MDSDVSKSRSSKIGYMRPGASYRVVVVGKSPGHSIKSTRLPTENRDIFVVIAGEGGGSLDVEPLEFGGSFPEIQGALAVFAAEDPLQPIGSAVVTSGHSTAGGTARLLADVVNMERSVSALGPAIAALDIETSPPLASAIQATENLWSWIDRQWGLLRSTDVAELLGAKTSNRSYASSLRKKGKLIGVGRANAYVYPGFQFDRQTGTVHDVIPLLIGAARDQQLDDEDLVFWLCSPSRYFDDDLPVDHLLSDPGIVDKFVASESVSW